MRAMRSRLLLVRLSSHNTTLLVQTCRRNRKTYNKEIGSSSYLSSPLSAQAPPIQAPPKRLIMTEVISISSDEEDPRIGQKYITVGAPKQVAVQRSEGASPAQQFLEIQMIAVDRSEIISPQDFQLPREVNGTTTGFHLSQGKIP